MKYSFPSIINLLLFFSVINLLAQKENFLNKQIFFSEKQQYLMEQYTINEGLSDNSITDILQDNKGYLWVGTTDGLNRFDGYQFKHFKYQPNVATSLSNNRINELLEDKNGQLWIATNGGVNLFDPTTETFQHFQHEPAVKNSLSSNQVRAIYEDSEGILWFGAHNGLNKFNKANKAFELFQHNATHVRYFETTPAQEISKIFEAAPGKLIIGYWGMGLMLFDKKKETFEQITIRGATGQFGWELTTDDIFKDKNGIIWVIAGGKIFQYEINDNQLKHLSGVDTPLGEYTNSFLPTFSNQYLVGGSYNNYGLRLFDEQFNLLAQFHPGTSNPINPNHNLITPIMSDRAGDVWFGTGGAGLFHLHTQKSPFINISTQASLDKTKKKRRINGLIEVDENDIWMSTRRQGLLIFDKKNTSFRPTPSPLVFPEGLLTLEHGSIYKDGKQNIWLGTWGRGLTLYNPKNATLRYFRYEYKNAATLSDRFVIQILETQEQEIWVATTRGLSVLSDEAAIQKGIFKQYLPDATDSTSLNHPRVNCILQRENGQIWLGTANGLHLYNRAQDNFIVFQHAIEEPASVNGNHILSIEEDRNQQLWIGTTTGLNKFIEDTQTFTSVKEPNGLLDGKVTSIHSDEKNQLWLGTKKGLVYYNPIDGSSKFFAEKEGLLNADFRSGSFLLAEKTGQIYIAGTEGISIFHPDSIQANTFVPPVVITEGTIYSEGGNKTLETNINGIDYKENITLSYHQNIITFQVAALNFRTTKKNKYAYKLEGFNDNWVNIDTKREITFTNLSPGDYTLQVKGSNNDGIWNEADTKLKITILPPWWRTNWAYLGYTLWTLFILYLIYRTLLRRQELQYQLQLEKSEAVRLKELDSFKTRLTTNLTHEFRTPLTIILGMTERISAEPKKYLKDGTRLIQKNGNNLLKLINQLLDLAKLEDQSFRLNWQQGDIILYLRYLTESFASLANDKNLALHFFAATKELIMDYDVEQIKQIMTNLVRNAIKFTATDGEVKVWLDVHEHQLKIEIIDTGIGIAADKLPMIFDRFYQVDGATTREGEGTGIGLAHTRELVKLMKGNIKVKSMLGKGTTFTVLLPIHNKAPFLTSISKNQLIDSPIETNKAIVPLLKPNTSLTDLPLLLIIEDNPDVVIYLKACLQGLFQLEVAYNGQIGIDKALTSIPDLIISDVMMPGKDGFEVCDLLKSDVRTSHIPIVLLTAKADIASKLVGLKKGADAYLSKPFDKEELLIRLTALVKRQALIQQHFSNQNQQETSNIVLTAAVKTAIQTENVFLSRIHKILEKHYADSTFGLPQLCQKIGMSRSQLFRKMKALVDTSPSAFIRTFRLNKAKALLEKGELNVSEVAWETGFVNLAHFSKVFQEEFGVLPSSITG